MREVSGSLHVHLGKRRIAYGFDQTGGVDHGIGPGGEPGAGGWIRHTTGEKFDRKILPERVWRPPVGKDPNAGAGGGQRDNDMGAQKAARPGHRDQRAAVHSAAASAVTVSRKSENPPAR